MSNINVLRDTLFDTLNKLKSGELEVDKARAINDVAQTIINSAKTEIEFMKVSGGSGTGFIPDATLPAPKGGDAIELPNGVRVIQHRMRG